MATSQTQYLSLILPANNSYVNTWNTPINQNFSLIDAAVGALQTEVDQARGSQASLSDRLALSMDDAGNPLPSPEVIAARVSSIYGGTAPDAAANLLDDRLEYGDREVFQARNSLTTLRDSLAWGADNGKNNSIVSAPINFLTHTGAVVSLNGNVTPVVANINGYRQVVSSITPPTVTITGGAGTYFLSLTRNSAGTVYFTGAASGTIDTYPTNALLARITDASQNFVAIGVKPGDVLNITGPTLNTNIGQYVVLATNAQDPTNLATNQLAVIGQFITASSGLNYTLTDPVAPTFGFTATAHAKTFTRVPNTIYIGRCVFDGTNVTGLTIYASNGVYSGFTSVTPVSGNFNLTVQHNLGYFPNKVSLYGSQAGDFSLPLDLLSVADISGGGSLERSVIAQMDDLNLYVKNTTNGIFYKDFGGTSQTSGFLYVQVER